MNSFGAFWTNSNAVTSRRFESFKIDFGTDKVSQLKLNQSSTKFSDLFGARSLLLFDKEVMIGGNVAMTDETSS